MRLTRLLEQARGQLMQLAPVQPPSPPGEAAGQVLFFSLGGPAARAAVHIAKGRHIDEAWAEGERLLAAWATRSGVDFKWLRVDWVSEVQPMRWSALCELFTRTKRNYFRFGLAFDPDFHTALLEQELAANAVLYDNKRGVATPNSVNLRHYGKQRFGRELAWPDQPDTRIWRFKTRAVFTDGQQAHLIEQVGPNRGYRLIPGWGAGPVREVIACSTAYLARQVQESGQYHYGWFPCFDRSIPNYNALRHASSTYALLEGWALTADPEQERAIRRALAFLTGSLIKRLTLPDGTEAAFLVDVGNEIKLGGNAVCLLAFSKYTELTGDTQYLELAEKLAVGMLHMQDPDTGAFTHVLNYPDLSVKAKHRIIYYDGEAAFGLMRLYGISKDERWLQAVVHAFDHFIAAEHWRAHDHWLSYCVNELTRYRPEERYYAFGLNNVRDHLDFVINRITTFPTLLELMMAAQCMIVRIQGSPGMAHLLADFDLEKFYLALETRARYLLSGFFWPELAMFFKNPGRILHGFFIRHHAFRVRIDDVEHYLSGYVAYWTYLTGPDAVRHPSGLDERRGIPGRSVSEAGGTGVEHPLSAASLQAVTGGAWVIAPPSGWQATGICVAPKFFQPGHLLFANEASRKGGLSPIALKSLARRGAAGILCEDAEPLREIGIPVLKVDDSRKAIVTIGRRARIGFPGRVLGVTGSAGKTTTVAMAAHALRQFGGVGKTVGSANLPIGIAWTMSSLPQAASCWVLELAVGQMATNTALAQPDVAIVTNIAPAHLEYHGTTEAVARKKARIFDGMPPGGAAVICRDMLHVEIFLRAAEQRALRILTYGAHEKADIRLLSVQKGEVKAVFQQALFTFSLAAPGKHMALNALAVIASIAALGLPWREALPRLASFMPVAGRGEQEAVAVFGRRVTTVNEAYNANPLSMAAALEAMEESVFPSSRRVLILADMLELGADAQHYHAALKEKVMQAKPDRVLLCGGLMKHLWLALAPEIKARLIRGAWFPDADTLQCNLPAWLEEGDVVLFKGSNSTRLHHVLAALKAQAG